MVVCGNKVGVCRGNREEIDRRALKNILERFLLDKNIEHGKRNVSFVDAKGAGGIALWVQVNENDRTFTGSQTGSEIDGGCCLSDAAFLIRDRDDTDHVSRSGESRVAAILTSKKGFGNAVKAFLRKRAGNECFT